MRDDTLIHGKFEFNGFRYEIHQDDEDNVYTILLLESAIAVADKQLSEVS